MVCQALILALCINLALQANASLQQNANRLLNTTGAPAIGIGRSTRHRQNVAVAGFRRLGSDSMVEPGDVWGMGSITKSMTSTLLARLAEKGILSFNDTIGDVLGPFIPTMLKAYKNVTYHQLVTHRSGIIRDPDTITQILVLVPQNATAARLKVAISVLGVKPLYKPGTNFSYSNAGYVVAGLMIEATTGMMWEDLMHKEVFAPLGMQSSGFGVPGVGGKLLQPRGHIRAPWGSILPIEPDELRRFAFYSAWAGPAGSYTFASLDDLLKYLKAHRKGDTSFLTRKSWMQLHTPPEGQSYAAGWVVQGNVRWHDGSNLLWYALAGFSLKEDRSMALVSNYVGGGETIPLTFSTTVLKFLNNTR